MKSIDLENITEEELLKTKICDLPISIKGSWLEECVHQLYEELDAKGIHFKPECYLSDEWLSPLNETCIGIPFYLAHPTLIKIEKKIMLEAEGETKAWCMKLLRHEAGHTLNHAYRLYRRKKWQELFGSPSTEYKDTYKYRPYSKNFVHHLDGYYAQYHPDEDFVETFAVWLTPGLDWPVRYKGWGVLRKLQYVDQVMNEIKNTPTPNQSSRKYWRLSSLRMSLNHYYKKKRLSWAEDLPDFHDLFLKKTFTELTQETIKWKKAFHIIRKYRREIVYQISRSSGERKYIINDLIKDISKRCQELKLVTQDEDLIVVLKITSYITALIMNYLYTGRFQGTIKRKLK
ncbi:MAG: hypothetical protein KC733_10115 [Candidatus Omnitrophica bacterium]|nr:hypothetical protein [Candidatus Omnitrophota bacterium]